MKDSQERINAIEINDLISDSIANAEERRKQGLLDLSEEELAKIEGGLASPNLGGLSSPILGKILINGYIDLDLLKRGNPAVSYGNQVKLQTL